LLLSPANRIESLSCCSCCCGSNQ